MVEHADDLVVPKDGLDFYRAVVSAAADSRLQAPEAWAYAASTEDNPDSSDIEFKCRLFRASFPQCLTRSIQTIPWSGGSDELARRSEGNAFRR